MRKYLLPIVLLVFSLLMPTALAVGDVKINDFAASVTSGNIPLHVYFTGNVTGIATNWHWKFTNEQTGLTTTSTANVTAVHNFLKPGIFDVQLNVSGLGGNDTLLKTAYITANALK
jgi:PKD repeat protein